MISPPALLTVGYEGAQLADFLNTLRAAGVTRLVDTRERAQSRRPGYSKTALSRALEEQGIGYTHLRPLGTPPSLRKAYRLEHDFALLERGYHAHLAAQGEALEQLGALAAQERTCLLCYEADPETCHRSLIAARLQALGLVGETVHLRVPGAPVMGAPGTRQ
ncbi:DUF488 domain-containing protein [Deinococcus budaensis]|uniref:Uncharacterized protein (DUF488 family) n=1 Tax=Deinococcus budaensis TaxID=1665626 RepID=A0A7W8GH98_9DEIO|nr:DUF488 domain-containing protein [Deinococcus budaensis]MBB5235615.1 uncharacterized protein (DUF488 family) [Deinococcus budaensis]